MDVGLSFLLLPLGRLRFGGDGNVWYASCLPGRSSGGRGRQGVGLSDGDRQRESVFP
jgi:hypothetical protein